MADALSDDEAIPLEIQQMLNGNEPRRAAKGQATRSNKRMSGAMKHVPSYRPPLPPGWHEPEHGKFQQYKLPPTTRIYERRKYDFTNSDLKIGEVRLQRPNVNASMIMFPDKHMHVKAKAIMAHITDDDVDQTDKLYMEACVRVARAAAGYFIEHELPHTGPTAEELGHMNAVHKAVFGEGRPGWTAKQVMSKVWPEVRLTGDALEYVKAGALANYQRDTQRICGLLFMGIPQAYEACCGIPNRFETLSGSVRTAVELLAMIVRDGLVGDDNMPRDDIDFDCLFAEHACVRGKDAPNSVSTENRWKQGDAHQLRLFDEPDEADITEWATVSSDAEKITVTARFKLLHKLTIGKLNAVLAEVETILPPKKRSYVTKVGKPPEEERTPKRRRLKKVGREAVSMLKKMLPVLSVPQLKKMLAACDRTLTAEDDKNKLCEQIVGLVVPGYPYQTPSDGEEGEVDEPYEKDAKRQKTDGAKGKFWGNWREAVTAAEELLKARGGELAALGVGNLKAIIVSRTGHCAKAKNNTRAQGQTEGAMLLEARAACDKQQSTQCPPAVDEDEDELSVEVTCESCGAELSVEGDQEDNADYCIDPEGAAICHYCGELVPKLSHGSTELMKETY
mmetsp:Transcript_50756/g.84131  ORF Transcript_50756/g.84131 Transcript_50756/m.84131 type:complete len:621 (+) Transcript_50756:212-2074(+)|eukprot:CAMPEP_0119337956 /NCGR_PEP_ID=MMETSP1333-20130426/95092_1 /TAXON_ID=418940 /ORGANISM="Scyphosphaera apsteinii, Strain RCC1455" /LENGTH=620 /DNA_ID=CAMNT_0007349125 /DNA_START=77 /DNA_END=1939 /DNA_ORIENTATION=-